MYLVTAIILGAFNATQDKLYNWKEKNKCKIVTK